MAGSIISELFIKFAGSSASLERATERVKLNVKQTAKEIRKETGQARDATELLGRTFGVQLPASVRKFLASVGPVRSLLGSAFQASIVGAFGVAIISLIPKIKQMAEEMGGLTQETKDWAAELVRANEALLLTSKAGVRELLSQVNRQIEKASFAEVVVPGGGEVVRVEIEQSDALTRLRRKQQELAERLNELDRLALKNRKEVTASVLAEAESVRVLTSALEMKQRVLETLRPLEFRPPALRVPVTTLDMQTFGPGSAVFEAGLRAETLRNLMPSPEEFAKVMGLFDPLKQKVDALADAAGPVKQKFQEAFQAIGQDVENAIVNFKGFGNVMVTVLHEIQRALLRIAVITPFVNLISGFIGRLFGGNPLRFVNPLRGQNVASLSPGLLPRQHGGPAFGGQAFLVGESGPEIFVPSTSGQIVPNGKMGTTIINNYNTDARGGSPGIEHRIREVLVALSRATKNAAVLEMREAAARTL